MKKRIGLSFTRTHFSYYRDWFTRSDLQNDLELVGTIYIAGECACYPEKKTVFDGSDGMFFILFFSAMPLF